MKINSSNKKKRSLEEKFPLIALGIIAFICITLMLAAIGKPTGNIISENTISMTGNVFLDEAPPETVSNIWDALNLVGNTWKDVIISVIVLLILFVGIYDLLELTTIFSNWWVILIISAGMSIIAALTNIIRNITYGLISFAAGFGALGIAIEIIISIIIFIGLSVGSNWIAKWAAKRKGQKEYIKSIKSSSEAGAAIRGLREIQQEFKRK